MTAVAQAGQAYSVVGLARSGVAAANALAALGADVLASDAKPAAQADALVQSLDPRVATHFGGNVVRAGDTVVMSPGVPPSAPIFAEAQRLGCRVISEIQLFQELRPDAQVLAVTGTDGKSTTTSWLGAMCALDRPTFVGGNIGIPLTGAVHTLAPGQTVVAEVSNAQLMTAPAFHPRVAVVTNIAPEHLDYHGSFEAYVAAKHMILENLGAGDAAVLRKDPLLGTWSAPAPARTFYFSRQGLGPAEDGLTVAERGGRPTVVFRDGSTEQALVAVDELALPGLHNLENAMAAAGAALLHGVALDHVRTTLRQFRGLEHRLERVLTADGITWTNDSKATNPHASLAGLTAFRGALVVIAGGYGKGADLSDWAERLASVATHVVLNGKCRDDMAAALAGRVPVTVVPTLEDAVSAAHAVAKALPRPVDVVLSPACSSFDQFRDFEDRGRRFKAWVAATST